MLEVSSRGGENYLGKEIGKTIADRRNSMCNGPLVGGLGKLERPVWLQCRQQGGERLEVRWRDRLELDLRGPVGHTGGSIFIQRTAKTNKWFLMGGRRYYPILLTDHPGCFVKKMSKMQGTGWGEGSQLCKVSGAGGQTAGCSEGGNRYTDLGATGEAKPRGPGAD